MYKLELDEFMINKEIKDNTANVVSELCKVMKLHEEKEFMSVDIFEELVEILDNNGVHLDDFTDALEEQQYNNVKKRLANILAEHKYDTTKSYVIKKDIF